MPGVLRAALSSPFSCLSGCSSNSTGLFGLLVWTELSVCHFPSFLTAERRRHQHLCAGEAVLAGGGSSGSMSLSISTGRDIRRQVNGSYWSGGQKQQLEDMNFVVWSPSFVPYFILFCYSIFFSLSAVMSWRQKKTQITSETRTRQEAVKCVCVCVCVCVTAHFTNVKQIASRFYLICLSVCPVTHFTYLFLRQRVCLCVCDLNMQPFVRRVCVCVCVSYSLPILALSEWFTTVKCVCVALRDAD